MRSGSDILERLEKGLEASKKRFPECFKPRKWMVHNNFRNVELYKDRVCFCAEANAVIGGARVICAACCSRREKQPEHLIYLGTMDLPNREVVVLVDLIGSPRVLRPFDTNKSSYFHDIDDRVRHEVAPQRDLDEYFDWRFGK